jgi:hypothetical protein
MPLPTQIQPDAQNAVETEIDKILRSPGFGGSETLRNMLVFLARRSIEHPSEPLKEYELGVSVLGKAENFDPRLDSAVRVHAARLRSKLAEYYMAEGANDPVRIEVPKGSYHLVWKYRNGVESATAAALVAVPKTETGAFQGKPFLMGLAAACAVFAVIAAAWLALRTPAIAPSVASFWRPFLNSGGTPIIVFSNHRFVGTSTTGLRVYRDGVDSPAEVINDTYSGTGTVMAVTELASLFLRAGVSPRLKRAELLTWDEAKTANVVFVGAPNANSPLRDLKPLRFFRFKAGDEEPGVGTGGVFNLRPAPGEPPVYLASAQPYSLDYAVIACVPGIDPAHKLVILAGTNTYGGQGAAEFLARPDLMQGLRDRLKVVSGAGFPDFEALLKVTVSRGVPVRSELLVVHPY